MTRETLKSMVLFVKSRVLDLRIYTRVWVQCIWNWSFLDLEPHVNPFLDSFSVQGDEPLFIFPYKREGDEPLALYTMYHCLQALKVEYSMEFRLKCCCCWIKSRFVSNPWPCCTTRHLLQHILRKKIEKKRTPMSSFMIDIRCLLTNPCPWHMTYWNSIGLEMRLHKQEHIHKGIW